MTLQWGWKRMRERSVRLTQTDKTLLVTFTARGRWEKRVITFQVRQRIINKFLMNCTFPSIYQTIATVVGFVTLDSWTNRFSFISDVSSLSFKHNSNCLARSCSFYTSLDGKKLTEREHRFGLRWLKDDKTWNVWWRCGGVSLCPIRIILVNTARRVRMRCQIEQVIVA